MNGKEEELRGRPRRRAGAESLHMLPSEAEGHYQVVGRFYAYLGKSGTYPCRDLLEIKASGVHGAADAVFIMMNPSSSEPIDGTASLRRGQAALVPTRPDTTQYQLMRLMNVFGWRRVKVLNLSDLRDSRSKSSYEGVHDFEQLEGHRGHPVFSPEREEDFANGLSRKRGAPLVAAWGVSKAVMSLACNALNALGNTRITGLPHANGRWAYRHPLPRTSIAQAQWRREALELLR